MEPDIKNFAEMERFIKENPREADAQAFEWQQFLKANTATSPELFSIETSEDFYKWAQEHPEKNINPSVWKGREISEAYYYLRDQHEDSQMHTDGQIDQSIISPTLIGTPLLAFAFLQRSKTMQEDGDYQKIE